MKEEAFYCLDCNSGIKSNISQNKPNIEEISTENSQILTQKEIDRLIVKVLVCYENLMIDGRIYIQSDEDIEIEEKRENEEKGSKEVVREVVKEKVIEVENKVEEKEVVGKMTDIENKNSNGNNENENNDSGVTCLSQKSYGLLESRVLWAVSGDQVAFERIRHAKQDAKIVRYVRAYMCMHVCTYVRVYRGGMRRQ